MIMYAQCPKCGGQLTEEKYTFPTVSENTLDRCMNCGWYIVQNTWLINELSDKKSIYESIQGGNPTALTGNGRK